MYRLFAALLVLISFTALADSPPSYSPFESKSKNSKFIAKVDVANRMGKSSPWEWKYNIKVFDVATMSKPLWESEYEFDGYSGGTLSNDGSFFAYVSFWFFDDGPIVYIYKKGSTKMYSAQDLRLTSKGLKETASHKLWLKNGGGFWPASGTPNKFIINTVQGERSIEL
jgi:hypothetical protein